ncbi:MAG: beta-eliminating lyase-related protein [Thermoplasmatales archaeon]|nr:beta-eliminating lyase-related protein [Thermoplasmatales archaeon]
MSEILNIVNEHNKYRSRTLNLQASENVLSPDAREALSSDMASRYSLLMNGEDSYGGTRFTLELVELTEKLTARVFRSKFAEVRPTGGHIASQTVILSTMKKKENMLSIQEKFGGYTGYQKEYLPKMFGIQNYDIPFNPSTQEIILDNLEKVVKSSKPSLMILGQSIFVRHYDLKPVREICDRHGCVLAYDGSHVMGLIGGNAFQKDVLQYCDILFGSTHKTFFGPQGGVILSNDEDIMERVRRNLTWRTMDNYHPSRLAALGVAMEEMLKYGETYARSVTENSKNLAMELSKNGIKPEYEPWYSETHQVIISETTMKKLGLDLVGFSKILEKNGIIVDREGRIGTAEISRMGYSKMDIIAELISRAVKGEDVSREVEELTGNLKISYWGE